MVDVRRRRVVTVRFNDAEFERLDALRGKFAMTKGRYIRIRALGDPLPRAAVVPELNRRAWVELSRAASNLNQIAHHMNAYGRRSVGTSVVVEALRVFRDRLIGASAVFGRAGSEE